MSILVSINCITYNHEKYIRQALDSFLMQKTKFEYEILIHDDASTDKTADIIREYEKKYPDIIKAIYQAENQYSKGNKKIEASYLYPLSRGKYIAVCEGDDYWTNPYKLQKQIDVLESNNEYTMCIHSTKIITEEGTSTGKLIRPQVGNTVFKCEDMILGGSFFHTSSGVYPKRFMEDLPQWYFEAPGHHTVTPLILANYGDVYYIDEVMSAWRKGTPGGWTTREWEKISRRKLVFEKLIKVLDQFDLYTNGKYSNAVNHKKLQYEINILRIEKNPLSLIFHPKYKMQLKHLSRAKQVKLMFGDLFTGSYRFLANSIKKFSK